MDHTLQVFILTIIISHNLIQGRFLTNQVCSKSSIFLTTYPPLNANMNCEDSLTCFVMSWHINFWFLINQPIFLSNKFMMLLVWLLKAFQVLHFCQGLKNNLHHILRLQIQGLKCLENFLKDFNMNKKNNKFFSSIPGWRCWAKVVNNWIVSNGIPQKFRRKKSPQS